MVRGVGKHLSPEGPIPPKGAPAEEADDKKVQNAGVADADSNTDIVSSVGESALKSASSQADGGVKTDAGLFRELKLPENREFPTHPKELLNFMLTKKVNEVLFNLLGKEAEKADIVTFIKANPDKFFNVAKKLKETNPDVFIQLLSLAKNSGVSVTDNIDLIDFAKKQLVHHPRESLDAIDIYLSEGGTVKYLIDTDVFLAKLFNLSHTGHLYHALKVLAKDEPFPDLTLGEKIKKFGLHDENEIFDIAKEAVTHSKQFCRVAGQFPINSESKRAELARVAIEVHGESALSHDFMENFKLSNPALRFSLAKFVAEKGYPFRAVQAFQIKDKDQQREIYRIGFEADPSKCWRFIVSEGHFGNDEQIAYYRKFVQDKRTNLVGAKEFISKITSVSTQEGAELFLLTLQKASYDEIANGASADLPAAFRLPSQPHVFISLMNTVSPWSGWELFPKDDGDQNDYVLTKNVIWFSSFYVKAKSNAVTNESLSWLRKEKLIDKTLNLRSPRLRFFLIQDLIKIANNQQAQNIFTGMGGKEFSRLPRIYLALLQNEGCSVKTCNKLYEKINQVKVGKHFLFKDATQRKTLLRVLHLLSNEKSFNAAQKEAVLKMAILDEMNPETILENLQIIRVLLANDPEKLSNARDMKTVRDMVGDLFSKVTGIIPDQDFTEQYLKTFGNYRNPSAILLWCSGLQKLDDYSLMERVTEFVDSVLNNTFQERRYDVNNREELVHLSEMFATMTEESIEKWKEGASYQIEDLEPSNTKLITKYEGYQLVDTDDPCDLLLSGSEGALSCLNVREDPNLNKALIAYLTDGKIRMHALKDQNGSIVARCMVRLLYDPVDNSPVLFQENIYPKAASDEEADLLNKLAIKRAEALGLPLLTKNMEFVEKVHTYPGSRDLESKSGELYEYVDAADGIQDEGVYTVNDAFLVFEPALTEVVLIDE